jgi:hypothetical protein
MAVDFDDSADSVEFADAMDLECEVLKGPRRYFRTAQRSGWTREAEQFFLGLPTQRKVAAAGRQKLGG